MLRRPRRAVRRVAALATASALVVPLLAAAPAPARSPAAREAEPIILTGDDLPTWSRLAATGTPNPYPSGALDGVRDAHNGTIVVPPDARTGVPVDEVAAFRWEEGAWREVPVQVDERFPWFLANANSDFGMYSGTDTELTYAWDVEAWKRTAGTCAAAYADGDGPMPDPVPGLDDDDEVVLMASDAGSAQAPAGAAPEGAIGGGQELVVADPLDPGVLRYAYLFRLEGGSSFDADNGYVRFERDADADEYIDRRSFRDDDPEKLGSSNTGYGPNLAGTVCEEGPDGEVVVRESTDRFPRDGHVVRTAAYEQRATGRWMLRELRVADPDQAWTYGPDLIDRWKGRAFQQSPDSSISLVGFEDEQVNWEANSTILGWRVGAVRAIREVWGADSGTNVTKTETYYRDGIVHRYRVRVHPIPPDGLYTSWDYNAGVAERYYNALNPEGVPIDGVNDDVGQVDQLPNGDPAFFDAPDPTFDVPLAQFRWEQVSGRDDAGSLVYVFEIGGGARAAGARPADVGASSLANPTVVPYYRDDACLDDGTGDDPVARPWPGETSTDQRVVDGYAAAAGAAWNPTDCTQRQGAYGAHGVHFFSTWESDNLFAGTPAPVNEIDGQQWQLAVPTEAPRAVGEPYALMVNEPLAVVAVPRA